MPEEGSLSGCLMTSRSLQSLLHQHRLDRHQQEASGAWQEADINLLGHAGQKRSDQDPIAARSA